MAQKIGTQEDAALDSSKIAEIKGNIVIRQVAFLKHFDNLQLALESPPKHIR